MQPLNPFLRALFRSTVPGQATPSQNHVVLVPATDALLNGRDRETPRPYVDLVRDEDFLASHVLRVEAGNGFNGRDVSSLREHRGKAKSYSTVNGRTVIIKENQVYSNKGFKTLSHAQLMSDVIYCNAHDNENWLIYYISRPLVGTFEYTPIIPALLGRNVSQEQFPMATSPLSVTPKKKDISSFAELLDNFPMIARQMQPGLERLLSDFSQEIGKPLPPPPARPSSLRHDSDEGSGEQVLSGSTQIGKANGHAKLPFEPVELLEDEENLLRRALETAVTTAIELFQLVDKQQLSLLGATTELTGPLVEQLIEQHVSEQVHKGLLFPRICNCHNAEDRELDRRIRQMEHVDVSQVGISTEPGIAGKRDLIRRSSQGVEAFRKINSACSPQEMLRVLLDTEKAVTDQANHDGVLPNDSSEKQKNSVMTINADVLVSLLLIVVIRSQVRHLQARLSYMQRFNFIDDVESGEAGYALSTFEAVLSYLKTDAGGLRRASMRNKSLWSATKSGNLRDMKAFLEDGEVWGPDDRVSDEPEEVSDGIQVNGTDDMIRDWTADLAMTRSWSSAASPTIASRSLESNLSHVFPFQTGSDSTSVAAPPKKGKRVSLDIRSLSGSSAVSFHSRTTTTASFASGIEGDTSTESLAKTNDATGNSIPMMAVEARQQGSLQYLLSLEEYYTPNMILEDVTTEGATLLSAAIQLAHTELIDIILDYISRNVEERAMIEYIAKPDSRGRTSAHYLFNAPQLVGRLNHRLPWRKKDGIGQTPLFALCRSYDHPGYNAMVSEALVVASEAQGDGLPLRLSDHTDDRGNTLLHIVNDPAVSRRILRDCDADPNATNDKKFTPLMLASKYGRIDMVRVLIGDPRVEINLKELRGLTAIELAKDDEVRSRIDDLALSTKCLNPESCPADGRVTTVVRSYFVEDGTTRFILKSGAADGRLESKDPTFMITTSRRTLEDFESLARWLALEHPASFLPAIPSPRSPFPIVSKPSRAVLHDTQTSLDRFLQILLAHPTFSTHETLWEFFLVPDMQSEQMAQRAQLKAELLQEMIQDDYDPVTDIRDVEQNMTHSQRMLRSLGSRTRMIIRRCRLFQHAEDDLADSLKLTTTALSSLGPPANALPEAHASSLKDYASIMTTPADCSPLKEILEAFVSLRITIEALQTSFMRPTSLISEHAANARSISRHRSSLASQSLPRKFNFPGTEESRHRTVRETADKIARGESAAERLSRELRWTTEVVIGELAGWTAWRETMGREAVKRYARAVVVKEKERGKRLERTLRALREGDE